MIALALACRPDVILADEPTTALDVMIQAQIMDLLASLGREMGMGTILVTHDLGVVVSSCDRVLVMYGGRIAEEGPTAALFKDPQHPYARMLIASFPDLATPDRELRGIPGTPPRLDEIHTAARSHRAALRLGRLPLGAPGDYPVGEGDGHRFLLDPGMGRMAERAASAVDPGARCEDWSCTFGRESRWSMAAPSAGGTGRGGGRRQLTFAPGRLLAIVASSAVARPPRRT